LNYSNCKECADTAYTLSTSGNYKFCAGYCPFGYDNS
jgi:hypothetical protein